MPGFRSLKTLTGPWTFIHSHEIFAGAGHHIDWDIVQCLNGRIIRLRMLTLATTDRAQPGPSHIQAICDATISGNADAAEAAVHNHPINTAPIDERVLAEEVNT